MSLATKTFLVLLVSVLCLSAALFMYRMEAHRTKALLDEKAQLESSAQALNTLRRDVEQYESTRNRIGGTVRHEKVSISTSFASGELPRLNDVLAGLYEANGFFLLENFSMSWEAGSDKTTGAPRLNLSLQGEKIFAH